MRNVNADNINILRYVRHLLRKRTLKQLLISVIIFSTSRCLLEHYVLNQYFPQLISDQVEDSLNEVFHSPTVFRMNYAEMERGFKIFVYRDRNITKYCDLPRKHNSKYESEEYFFRNLKTSPFLTDDPEEAHLFFLPICSQKMMTKEGSPGNVETIVHDYLKSLISMYPYWNRTLGADHFFVSCHDIGMKAAEKIPFLEKNTVRLVCSSSYDSKYIPHKDVAFQQIKEQSLPSEGDKGSVGSFKMSAVSRRMLPLKSEPPRAKLGYWVGSPDSDVRKSLVSAWQNDMELDIRTPNLNIALSVLQEQYQNTSFCICPRGTRVDGICLASSIGFGCVPAILSDYYDLPFSDVLDWNTFSVIVKEEDVSHLKRILKGIPETKFEKMRQNVLKVQKHFQWNSVQVKYDAFHMVMYELWMRRHTIRPRRRTVTSTQRRCSATEDTTTELAGDYRENRSCHCNPETEEQTPLNHHRSTAGHHHREDRVSQPPQKITPESLRSSPEELNSEFHRMACINCRTTLAFWSGQPDSHIRETLINNWGFDPELEIHIGFEASTAEGRWEFHDDLSKSKFCICPGGPQLDGVLAAAINYGCVPVILSDYYDVPFKDILDWKKFSVIIKEIDVYQLKKILAEIPNKEYEALHTNAIMVQKHFEWNLPPVRLDAFHMVMYELWMRRRVTKY